jgi:hypothetical protein
MRFTMLGCSNTIGSCAYFDMGPSDSKNLLRTLISSDIGGMHRGYAAVHSPVIRPVRSFSASVVAMAIDQAVDLS